MRRRVEARAAGRRGRSGEEAPPARERVDGTAGAEAKAQRALVLLQRAHLDPAGLSQHRSRVEKDGRAGPRPQGHPGIQSAGITPSRSSPMSKAAAECVSAPTEITSAPALAYSATLLEVDAARGLDQDGAGSSARVRAHELHARRAPRLGSCCRT